jgi:hypothetical protein
MNETELLGISDKTVEEIRKIISSRDITIHTGTITLVGRDSVGQKSVTFNDDQANTSTGSIWPDWAYQVAELALLHNKKVVLGFNGTPVGPNIVHVLVMSIKVPKP